MKKRYYSICVILWVLITTLSATSPTTFHIALKKIYPHAMNVSWSQQGNYYVASFTQNGFEKKVSQYFIKNQAYTYLHIHF